jgi:hypothetical protein
MHGGAKGSGGPRGKRNGNFKHGLYSARLSHCTAGVSLCGVGTRTSGLRWPAVGHSNLQLADGRREKALAVNKAMMP